MKNEKLSIATRIITAICGISLVAVLFVPMWRIDLDAPQYPEGLRLKIYANAIKGDVDIINGLNHYIGMKTLHTDDFPEFTILPYCIGFFVVCFLLISLLNRKKWFYAGFLLFVSFGIIAMVDFWKWEYDYGHNLDPHAAIVVPGMAYQPPLIGFKQLLNFGAYSIPDIGGWIFVGCGALLLLCVVIEWRSRRKVAVTPAVLLLLLPLVFSSCNAEPDQIKIGKDNCAFCKMTISDPRFGAELLTSKGKSFKFDDIVCLKDFMKSREADLGKDPSVYFSDFSSDHKLTISSNALLLNSPELKCPMDGHMAAFSNQDSLNAVKSMFNGEQTNWESIK